MRRAYNLSMALTKGDKKSYTLGVKISGEERARLNAFVNQIRIKEKRASAAEIYRELLCLNQPDLVTEQHRRELLGLPPAPKLAPDISACCDCHAEIHRRLTAILHSGYEREVGDLTGNVDVFYRLLILPAGDAPEGNEPPGIGVNIHTGRQYGVRKHPGRRQKNDPLPRVKP